MARPVKKRVVKSYFRDIETLGRLRTALLQDTTCDWTVAKNAISQIDALTSSLRELARKSVEKSAS